eukprot:2125148-Rhodomonas_salina.2
MLLSPQDDGKACFPGDSEPSPRQRRGVIIGPKFNLAAELKVLKKKHDVDAQKKIRPSALKEAADQTESSPLIRPKRNPPLEPQFAAVQPEWSYQSSASEHTNNRAGTLHSLTLGVQSRARN